MYYMIWMMDDRFCDQVYNLYVPFKIQKKTDDNFACWPTVNIKNGRHMIFRSEKEWNTLSLFIMHTLLENKEAMYNLVHYT
jgi:hypothetical protein